MKNLSSHVEEKQNKKTKTVTDWNRKEFGQYHAWKVVYSKVWIAAMRVTSSGSVAFRAVLRRVLSAITSSNIRGSCDSKTGKCDRTYVFSFALVGSMEKTVMHLLEAKGKQAGNDPTRLCCLGEICFLRPSDEQTFINVVARDRA
ncbi:hypothetical protein EVAR_84321_1 [Eumeta japonica]|uniref:Uncharacterized protein n=1 Tax=Eumeta variegata TaxID=151549 RepID=A0A4C1U4L6_EUMVA|nr:hypothetical protein EVAR_84321_1 [Eumeta japonica]